FRSAAILREYFGEILFHRPERSGLPSSVRGAGAARLGLPSGVRGIPGVGWFNHWAASGALNATVTATIRDAFMLASSLRRMDAPGPQFSVIGAGSQRGGVLNHGRVAQHAKARPFQNL